MFHRNQDKRNYSETRNPKSRISESCWTKYPFIRNSDPIQILRCHKILWSCILSRSLGSHLEVDPCIFMMWAFAESHLFVVYTETKPKNAHPLQTEFSKNTKILSHFMISEKPIENDGVLLVQFWFVVKDGILHVQWLFTACCWKTEKKNLKDKLNMTGHVIITFNAQLRRY